MKKILIIGGIVVFFFVLIVGAVLLAGNTGKKNTGSKEQVELVWWKPFNDRSDMEALISEYQKVRKNVTIKYVKKNINTYEEELLNAIASGNSPDIFSIHNDWLPKHIDKMAPITEGLMSQREYEDAFVDVAADDFIKDGKIYSMPLTVDVLGLYYNKDILGSAGIFTPPKTWLEVTSDVQKITKIDAEGNFTRSGISLGTSTNINRSTDILLLLMLQNGTQFYNATYTTARFNQDISANGENYNPGEMALSYFTQFAKPSNKAYTWNNRADNSVDAFVQGKLGMMLSYSYMAPTLRAKAPNLNWGVVGVPQVDTSDLKVNFANYWGESVSKTSKKQAAAWDFLKFITQHDVLAKYQAKIKSPSSRKDLLKDQSKDLDLGVFAENAITAKGVYKSDANQFEIIFLKMIDDVNLRGKDPDDAINAAVSQVNNLLRD